MTSLVAYKFSLVQQVMMACEEVLNDLDVESEAGASAVQRNVTCLDHP